MKPFGEDYSPLPTMQDPLSWSQYASFRRLFSQGDHHTDHPPQLSPNEELTTIVSGHMSFYRATDTPVLDFWWRLLWVSKHESKALFELGGGAFDVCPLRFTSGATPADLLMASMVASRCSLHACFNKSRMPDSIGRPPALMYLSCCFVVGPGDLPDPGITRIYLPPDVR